MKITLSIWVLFFLGIQMAMTQDVIREYGTYYDDTYNRWIVYSDQGEGSIEAVWENRLPWDEWSFRLGEHSGTIKSSWNGDLNDWLVTINGVNSTVRSIFRNDHRRLEVKERDFILTLEYNPHDYVWFGKSSDNLQTLQYTFRPGDLRDWVIEGTLPPDASLSLQVAATFVPIILSVPHQ